MRKIRKQAMILALLASVTLLSGCKKKPKYEIINAEDGIYAKSDDGEYNRIYLEPKEFEAGAHYYYYTYMMDKGLDSNYPYLKFNPGINNSDVKIPRPEEGYKLIDSTPVTGNSGVCGIMFIYENTVPVLVEATFDVYTGEIRYDMPGKVIESEKKLELGD